MIKTIKISNFRSLKDCSVTFAPITYFYGNNAAGKSSLLYALFLLKSILTDPNKQLDALFNFNFINLGGFSDVIFDHDDNLPIIISVIGRLKSVVYTYKIELRKSDGSFTFELGKPYFIKLNLPVTFPYPSNGSAKQQIKLDEINYNISWNGATTQISPDPVTDESTKLANNLMSLMNEIIERIRSVDLIPMLRGFTRPLYGAVSVGTYAQNQDELMTLLSKDSYLDIKISNYLEQIMDRQARIYTPLSTSLIYYKTTEKETKRSMDIVNDGYGVNQLVYLLAKCLNKNVKIGMIEEPETNLHPKVVNKLPKVFIEIARDEEKQLIISTHSENLIVSTLKAVSVKAIKPEDVACYLTTKTKGTSRFERQHISKEGKIEGGLISFISDELDDLTSYLGKPKINEEPISIEDKLSQIKEVNEKNIFNSENSAKET